MLASYALVASKIAEWLDAAGARIDCGSAAGRDRERGFADALTRRPRPGNSRRRRGFGTCEPRPFRDHRLARAHRAPLRVAQRAQARRALRHSRRQPLDDAQPALSATTPACRAPNPRTIGARARNDTRDPF